MTQKVSKLSYSNSHKNVQCILKGSSYLSAHEKYKLLLILLINFFKIKFRGPVNDDDDDE